MPVDLILKPKLLEIRKKLPDLRKVKPEDLDENQTAELRLGNGTANLRSRIQVPNADVASYTGDDGAYIIAPSSQSAGEEAAMAEVAKAAMAEAFPALMDGFSDKLEAMVTEAVEKVLSEPAPDKKPTATK